MVSLEPVVTRFERPWSPDPWRCGKGIVGLGVLVLGLWQCGVDGSTVDARRANECPRYACDAFSAQAPRPVCQGGICVTNESFPFALGVFVPRGAYAPDEMMVYSASELTASTKACEPSNAKCLWLRSPVRFTSDYVATADAVSRNGVSLGNDDASTRIPVRVRWRPLWPVVDGLRVPAGDLGLTLFDKFATLNAEPAESEPKGPDRTGGIVAKASLLPGVYERSLEPLSPYDQWFPPDRVALAVGTQDKVDRVEVDKTDKSKTLVLINVPVLRRGGTLDAFSVRLVDPITREVLSTTARVQGRDDVAAIRYLAVPTPRAYTLVVEPPATDSSGAVPLPRLEGAFKVGLSAPLDYPELPPPVTWQGVLRDGRGQGSSFGRMALRSSEITAFEDGKVVAKTTLVYETVVEANKEGEFSVLLPPGKYSTVVAPREDRGQRNAQAVVGVLQRASREVVLDNPVLRDDVRLGTPVTIRGRVRLADGRALGAGWVRGQRLPRAPEALPLSMDQKFEAEHRPAIVASIGDGGDFEWKGDFGDVVLTVMPPAGERLPWVVVTLRDLKEGAVREGLEITVPAPVVYENILRDPAPSPANRRVGQALVHAYVQDAPTKAFLLLGTTISDRLGNFRLDLAKPVDGGPLGADGGASP